MVFDNALLASNVSRRRFLRQSFAWSAMAALPALPAFATKAADPHAAHALVLGDWGYQDKLSKDDMMTPTSHAAQSQVARGMRHYTQSTGLHPEALFMLGDSWYGDLDGGAHSPRWVEAFEELYPQGQFPGPVYTMLGNHDYQKLPPEVNKVEAELEYARIGRGLDGKPTRWTLPSKWYTFDFPTHTPLMHVIVLDSNMPKPSGVGKQSSANFTLTPDEQAAQLAWLEQQLQKPRTAPFLAVLAHHPVFSDGPHGDHPILTRDWEPLFQKYKVDLYMAGHDHDLQHLEFEGHPTTHFLSGGGGADLYVLKTDGLERGPYAQEVHGFSHLSVTRKVLELRHLDADGRFLYGIAKTPSGLVTHLSA
jgi:tartrate-resistant acid phosphatase type 5